MNTAQMKEVVDSIQETIRHHLFETADELGTALEERHGIPRENVRYEMVNGRNEITIKFPDKVDGVNCSITILGEEVVNG